ncbi:peptidoglycan DD-metalloendopeptidase family protein [Streptomyces katsurahamanus]|nr:M23 family metallopeptidase [Streptomyces katsurahamanus]
MWVRRCGRLPLVPMVLCALLLGPSSAVPAWAAASGAAGADPGTEVTRLYEETARAAAAYERGRRSAQAQRIRAEELQKRLDRRRRELAAVHDAVGAVARARYRTGGPLSLTARLLYARDPEELLLGRRYAMQAEDALSGLLDRAREAARRLAVAEGRARAAWRELDRRRARLAAARRTIETRLEVAQRTLRAEAVRDTVVEVCPVRARRLSAPPPVRETPPEPVPGILGIPVPARPSFAATALRAVPGARSVAVPVPVVFTGDRNARPPARIGGSAPESGTAGRAVAAKASWVAPVERYRLSASFGGAGKRWEHRHTGQDFAVGIGTPVRSVGAGRVWSVSCGGPFGLEIVVQHPGGYYTQYAHLASAAVARGDRVHPGRLIGLAGTTGNSTGPHLHFEVRLTPYLGSGVDPAHWLRERGVRV